MIEYALKDVIFHFNKGHLQDSTIPMWVLKFKGKTVYINHVTSTLPWSTKETPGNEATKGSIKFKSCLLTISDHNEAIISPLTEEDKYRLKKAKNQYTRIIATDEYFPKIKKYLDENNIKYSKFKKVTSGCGSWTYYISDIKKKEDMVMLCLVFSNNEYRILQENEEYYKFYERSLFSKIINLVTGNKDEYGKDEFFTNIDSNDVIDRSEYD